jgi:hypothetical protein
MREKRAGRRLRRAGLTWEEKERRGEALEMAFADAIGDGGRGEVW